MAAVAGGGTGDGWDVTVPGLVRLSDSGGEQLLDRRVVMADGQRPTMTLCIAAAAALASLAANLVVALPSAIDIRNSDNHPATQAALCRGTG